MIPQKPMVTEMARAINWKELRIQSRGRKVNEKEYYSTWFYMYCEEVALTKMWFAEINVCDTEIITINSVKFITKPQIYSLKANIKADSK